MPTWLTRERLLVIGVFAVLLYASKDFRSLGWDDFWYIAVIIPSIVLHEISHGWLANAYGDPTAKNAGRLTLNPIPHIDPFGTIILPAVLTFIGAPAFGWAKPVPVNVSRMSKNKSMFVGLVGPFTNVIISLVAIGIFAAAYHLGAPSSVLNVIGTLGLVNVILAVFNMIPIPPLDGSSVIERFIPRKYEQTYYGLRRYSFFILAIFVFAGQSVLGSIFEPFQTAWLDLLQLVVFGSIDG